MNSPSEPPLKMANFVVKIFQFSDFEWYLDVNKYKVVDTHDTYT